MRKLETAVGIISVIFIAWIFISWLDVMTNNVDASPIYASWNFFNIFFK